MNEHILDRGTQVAEHRSLGFRWRGWIGIAVLVPAGMFTLLSLPPSHEGSWADIVAEALAWPVFLAGGTLRFWATLYVGGRKRKTVVREGPYSICRNPLYLGSLLLALSSGLFLQSVTFTIGACLMAIGYMVVTVPVEERFLLARLGQEYEAYCRSVPRYLPRLSALVTPAYVDVDVRALAQEASKAIGWIWIPVIAEVVMQLRLLPWWPHWFSLP
jgi:protein-S-isoprenylcysteine O-methyltransferase Ste14